MRALSFVLACAFIMAAPPMAGSFDGNLPGIGSFSYSGSPIPAAVPRTVLVASR
jgi:hypothetical protein